MLDAPEPDRVSAGLKRRTPVAGMPLRRDSTYIDDFASDPDSEFAGRRRTAGVRVSFRGGLLPKTLWGRIAGGCAFLLLAAAAVATAISVRSFLLHDQHFVVAGSESIQIAGNSHLTRAQLLSVFGEDVDRNIFTIPLATRRTELESLPWVEHATVMRLLPNRVRVAIIERTPIAFVRQGTQIGLVDANGVLFDLPEPDVDDAGAVTATAHSTPHYSFPVLTGISAEDPLSLRAARMKIYMGFVAALDASGEGISHRLSEVDLSNPEDVKAIVPSSESGADAAPADILVHFGEEKFLERYHQYQQHLTEWRAQYPRLASVDMRYERQVVLQMQPGTAPQANLPAAASSPPPTQAPSAARTSADAIKTPATVTPPTPSAKVKTSPPALKPAARPAGAAAPGGPQ